MIPLLWLLLLAAVATMNPSRSDLRPAFPDPPPGSIQARAPVDLPAWHYDQLVGGYLAHGHRDPGWDSEATNALGAFAGLRSRRLKANDPEVAAITNLTMAAFEKGCADPLLRYLHWRRNGAVTPGTADLLQVADALDATDYSPLLKSYAYLRAFDVLYPRPSTNRVPANALRAREVALARFHESIAGGEVPGPELLDLGRPLSKLLWANDLIERHWTPIEQALTGQYSDVVEAQLLLGETGISHAWRARGGGFADTVSQEGWSVFEQKLQNADKALRQAWQLDPTVPEVPYHMVTICRGLSHPRQEMEKWFDRARHLRKGWYDLYYDKGQYLMPKWHGSRSEVLGFGRQCLTDTNAVGRPRLMIVDFHEELETFSRDRDPESGGFSRQVNLAYYQNPRVWNDIRTAFETFFREVPDGQGWHHNYALHAWRAGDWKTLNAEIPKLGRINFKYFGGREAYEQMLADARAHESP